MAMIRRLISATLSLTLTMVHASALADHRVFSGAPREGDFFSLDNMLLAITTSFLTGLVCYALMVWDPKGGRRQHGPDTDDLN